MRIGADPTTVRTAYLDCIGGVAGDMLLAALLDAGAAPERLLAAVEALGFPEVGVEVERTRRHGIDATHVRVVGPEPEEPIPVDRLRSSLAGSASVLGAVVEPAVRALDRLIAAEARVHGSAPHDVVLHELGGVDTIVDICGAFVLLDDLGIDRLVCSPLPMARGLSSGHHGRIPSPGPAVLELLRGARVVGVEDEVELVTPTGAAIVASAASGYGALPPMRLDAVGYGAGSRDTPERPNVLRVVVGTAEAGAEAVATDVVLLEANLDDLVPELVPDAIEACTVAGALDVWTTPVLMKKGRPGVVLSALARPSAEGPVADALLEHTTTLGVRSSRLSRYELERAVREVQIEGHPVRLKLGILRGRVVNVAPEHDDCAEVAAKLGRPVKSVWAAALSAAADLDADP